MLLPESCVSMATSDMQVQGGFCSSTIFGIYKMTQSQEEVWHGVKKKGYKPSMI